MSKYYLVVNPHGGHRKGLAILEKVEPIFKEAGAEIDIKETRYAGRCTKGSDQINAEAF